MAQITSRPPVPDSIPESGRQLINELTFSVIWLEESIQYMFGGANAVSLDSQFAGSVGSRYSGALDASFAFSGQLTRAFELIDTFLALDFSKTTSTAAADIIFASSPNNIDPDLKGFSQAPGSSGHPAGGSWTIGVITSDNTQLLAQPEIGGGEYLNYLLLHEIGHSLGLGHTHSTPGAPLPSIGPYLDNEAFSVMSYNSPQNSGDSFGHAVSMMALDIAALQSLYGAEDYATGHSTYTLLDPGTGPLQLTEGDVRMGRAFYCIWDSGGTDQIAYGGSQHAVLINLNAATLDTAGASPATQLMLEAVRNTTYYNLVLADLERFAIATPGAHAGGFFSGAMIDGRRNAQGFSIAHGVVIENATGGVQDDLLIGNMAGNILTGGDGADTLVGALGDDTLIGGAGADTAGFSAIRSAYSIDLNGLEVTVSGPEGTDTMTGVELFQFDDRTLGLMDASADPASLMSAIRDFSGNDLGGGESWVYLGSIDVQGDGDAEHVFLNAHIGRWATVGIGVDGFVDFGDHSWGGDTRVVGIYIDPLVVADPTLSGGPFDSQLRFQNDLLNSNIGEILGAGDYDDDGLQEVYFAIADGTAYLHAYMHADGNIRYANYQNQQQVIDFLQGHGFGQETYGDWFG